MLQTWSEYHNVIISYYHNILIRCTTIQPSCSLRTPFDMVFNTRFDYGYSPERSLQKYMVCKYAIFWLPGGFQTWFLVHSTGHFTTITRGYLPGLIDPNRNSTKVHVQTTETNASEIGVQRGRRTTHGSYVGCI